MKTHSNRLEKAIEKYESVKRYRDSLWDDVRENTAGMILSSAASMYAAAKDEVSVAILGLIAASGFFVYDLRALNKIKTSLMKNNFNQIYLRELGVKKSNEYSLYD
jgi:hypothetical protein